MANTTVKPKGEFVRSASTFRNWVTKDGSSGFPAESGRYHLYIANSCPWAHRTYVTRQVKGLQDCISLSICHFRRDERGWKFFPDDPGTTGKDTLNGATHIRDIYFLADKDYDGRFSVPVLWDKKTKTIVNNESSEIIRVLGSEFNEFSATDEQRALDLYPENLRKEIDELNEWIYKDINNGVYRAGFAESQEAYDTAVRAVFAGLDRVEEILSRQRYLTGSTITEADIRLFTTLVRFDTAYNGHFKCNKKRIVDYPNIWPYLRDLYQTKGFGETVNLDHIKKGYMGGISKNNPFGIVSIGSKLDFNQPHNRATRFN